MELFDVGSSGLAGFDLLHSHDLDGRSTGPVTSTHVTICQWKGFSVT